MTRKKLIPCIACHGTGIVNGAECPRCLGALRETEGKLGEQGLEGLAPEPGAIRAAREATGLSQEQAAALVHLGSYRRWGEYERGVSPMDAARWELFLVKTGQHPAYTAKGAA